VIVCGGLISSTSSTETESASIAGSRNTERRAPFLPISEPQREGPIVASSVFLMARIVSGLHLGEESDFHRSWAHCASENGIGRHNLLSLYSIDIHSTQSVNFIN
jgi:hypothetical protein